MKRTICLGVTGLFFVSVALLGCAQVPVQRTIVTRNNLSTLKGTWSGWTTFTGIAARAAVTEVIISNDSVPIEGAITLYNLDQSVASQVPKESVSASSGDITINFKNGHISDKGTLLGTSGQNFLELTYYAGEKPRMEGWFYYYGVNGTMTVTKK